MAGVEHYYSFAVQAPHGSREGPGLPPRKSAGREKARPRLLKQPSRWVAAGNIQATKVAKVVLSTAGVHATLATHYEYGIIMLGSIEARRVLDDKNQAWWQVMIMSCEKREGIGEYSEYLHSYADPLWSVSISDHGRSLPQQRF